MSELRNGQTLPDAQREAAEKKRRHRLSRRSSSIKPKIWIGKTGITATLIEQLNRQLKADKLVKVKVQKSIAGNEDMGEISNTVASATGSSVIDVRGRTFTLYRSKSEDKNKSS